jgi:DNA-binding NtrC family response regulator
MGTILIVSKKKGDVQKIQNCFGSETKIDFVLTNSDAIEIFRKKRYDYVFIDMGIFQESVQDNNFKATLESFWQLHPTIEIIVMTTQEKVREAVKAVKAGASDYLTYPIDSEEIKYVIENIRESVIVQSEIDYLRDEFWDVESLDTIDTKSILMKKVYEKVRSVAPTKSTVLITGDTGTGKGVLASIIHKHSNRRNAQFISIHCGAIPDTLLESELFGHEKGAFTGAIKRKLGKFEIANGGTIFLDEIGTITPSAQIKLLQVLQDGIFQRVGGEEVNKTDVRIITATNSDLKKMCDEGTFRKDLYYRLNVFPIEIPPLKERTEDIPRLVKIFIKRMNKLNTKEISLMDPNVLKAFINYSWPGNIREMENLIERAFILETSSTLTPDSFPAEMFDHSIIMTKTPLDSSSRLADARQKAVEAFERNYLKELLILKRGKIKDSAEAAGITTRQLNKLMAKYGIRKEEFKAAS